MLVVWDASRVCGSKNVEFRVPKAWLLLCAGSHASLSGKLGQDINSKAPVPWHSKICKERWERVAGMIYQLLSRL